MKILRIKGKFYVITQKKDENNKLIERNIKIFNSMKGALDYGLNECPDLHITDMCDDIINFAIKSNHKIFDYKWLYFDS